MRPRGEIMFMSTLIVVSAVASIVFFWVVFMVWVVRSGQRRGMKELSRLPLEEDNPEQDKKYD